jgi:hypothetical protein
MSIKVEVLQENSVFKLEKRTQNEYVIVRKQDNRVREMSNTKSHILGLWGTAYMVDDE